MHMTSRLSNSLAGSAACAPLLAAAIAATAAAAMIARPATARDTAFEGRIAAVSLGGEMPGERSVKVRVPEAGRTGTLIRSIFSEELENRGYRLDIAPALTVELVWGGAFDSAGTTSPRVTLRGEGGSRTTPSLGLNLRLGAPSNDSSTGLYALGCRLFTEEGPVWKAKAVARGGSGDIEGMARALSAELIEAFGRNVDDAAFGARPAQRPRR